MGEAISQGGQRSHRAPPSSASAARPHRTEAPGEHLLRRGPMPGLPVGSDRPARPSPWPAQQVRLMLAEGSSEPRGNYSETPDIDRKSTRLNSSHVAISYAVLRLKKKNTG